MKENAKPIFGPSSIPLCAGFLFCDELHSSAARFALLPNYPIAGRTENRGIQLTCEKAAPPPGFLHVGAHNLHEPHTASLANLRPRWQLSRLAMSCHHKRHVSKIRACSTPAPGLLFDRQRCVRREPTRSGNSRECPVTCMEYLPVHLSAPETPPQGATKVSTPFFPVAACVGLSSRSS